MSKTVSELQKTIRATNLDEQLSSLKRMIQIESNALTTLAGERAAFVNEMCSERDELIKQLEDIRSSVKNALLEREKTLGLSRVALSDLNALESKIEALRGILQEIESKEREAVASLAVKVDKLKVEEEECDIMISSIEEKKAILQVEELLLNTNVEKILDRTKKAELKLESMSKATSEAQRLCIEEESKLLQTIELNKLESTKNINTIRAIEERENEIARRERNFQIMKLRFNKTFQKLYPGQNLDNLI